MNGFDRLREQVKDQGDAALKQTIEYLISREDMEKNYLKEEKTVEDMCSFIRNKGQAHARNGWNYITNEVVYAWAIMYWSLPNVFLKINQHKANNDSKEKNKQTDTKNNVVSIEKAKEVIEKKKEVSQLSLFGGVAQ